MVNKVFALGLASFFALATAQYAGAQYQSGQQPPATDQSRPSWQDQGQSNRDREMSTQQQYTPGQADQYQTGKTGQPGRTGDVRQDQTGSTGQEQRAASQPNDQQPSSSQDNRAQDRSKQAASSQEKSKRQHTASMYLDASKLMGAKVKDRKGKDAGSVSNLILDRSGKVVYVIMSEGGFAGMGAKKISVPVGAVTITGSGDKQLLTVNVDQEQLNSAPEYNNLADLDNRLYSETIYRFFGLQPQWSDQGQMGAAQQEQQGSISQQSSQNQWHYQEQQASQTQQQNTGK